MGEIEARGQKKLKWKELTMTETRKTETKKSKSRYPWNQLKSGTSLAINHFDYHFRRFIGHYVRLH